MSDRSSISTEEFRAARTDVDLITGALDAGAGAVRLGPTVARNLCRAFDAMEHAVDNMCDVVESRQQEIDEGYKKIAQLQRRLRDSKTECEQLRVGEAKEAESTPISEAQFLEGRDLVAALIPALGTKGDRKVAVAASHVQAIARSLRYLATQRDQARAEVDARSRAYCDEIAALQRKVSELEYIATEQEGRAEVLLLQRDEARAEAVRLGKRADENARVASDFDRRLGHQRATIEDLGRDLEAVRAENGRLRGQLQAVKNFVSVDLGEQVF